MALESFQRFYADHHPLILTIAHQRLGDFALAEDITSEVFRITWEHYLEGGSLKLPWVYQTLRNLVGNQYRHAQRTVEVLSLLQRENMETVMSNDSVEDAMLIRKAMLSLSETDREILMMIYWEDLTRAEAARILGCSPAAMRVRLFRAKERLRSILKDPVLQRVAEGKEG
ncbi:RNA polymerase sigma factor [Flaviflexus huanghaiensis]|uniref:RNA polymerase sigma factor n=1 Tax=Flaviflexus huanghaiensis TaxID=1111473 RepID=UPI0015F7A888|nr:sigma-70 family RNA polymerase sigma factor [Flaviflexus huanghaiensis]